MKHLLVFVFAFLVSSILLVETFSKNDENFTSDTPPVKISFHNFTSLEEAKADVEKYILGFKEKLHIPAFLFAFAVKGKTVMKKAWGTADLENNLPANVDNAFRIGSISKSFTSAIIGQLVDQGKLHYEDLVSKHLSHAQFLPKSFSTGNALNITLRHLLSHSAGIPSSADHMFQQINPPTNVSQMILRFRETTNLVSEPGTTFEYSNVGYQILGAVIESVTGKSFQEVLTHFLTHEAKLPTALLWDTTQTLHNVPRYYAGVSMRNLAFVKDTLETRSNNSFPSAPIDELIFLNGWWPAGGIVATLEDLLRWGQKLIDAYHGRPNPILSKKVLAEMWSPVSQIKGVPITTANSSYGYGWFVSHHNQVNRTVVFHAGGLLGVSCQLTLFPDEEMVGVTFSNKGVVVEKEQMVLYAAANLYHLVK